MKITKKLRKETVRNIIDRYDILTPFDGQDTKTFNEMTGAAWEQVRREINPVFPNAARFVTVSDVSGIWEPWSWVKAIDGWKPTSPQLVAKAMRQAVAYQMREWRDKADQTCAGCGTIDDLTVDHIAPSFDSIVKQFNEQFGEPTVAYARAGEGLVVSDDHITNWLNFHSSHADYQVLCRSCNSRKGAA